MNTFIKSKNIFIFKGMAVFFGMVMTCCFASVDHSLILHSHADAEINLQNSEVQKLLYQWEENKLVRDISLMLYSRYGDDRYAEVSNAEQIQTNSIKETLDKMGVKPKVDEGKVGKFSHPALKRKFGQYMIKAESSEFEAFELVQAIASN